MEWNFRLQLRHAQGMQFSISRGSVVTRRNVIRDKGFAREFSLFLVCLQLAIGTAAMGTLDQIATLQVAL